MGMTKKSKCDEIEEDKSDDDIDVSENAGWENTTMNLLHCNLCEKTSTTVQGLERHKYRYHPARRENISEANEIDKNEDTKDGIIDVSTSSVCEDATLDCNLCEKTSKTVQGLDMHKYRYHSAGGEKMISCDLCDATSKSKAGLWQHKKRHH